MKQNSMTQSDMCAAVGCKVGFRLQQCSTNSRSGGDPRKSAGMGAGAVTQSKKADTDDKYCCKCSKYCSRQCQASNYKKHCKVWAEGKKKLTRNDDQCNNGNKEECSAEAVDVALSTELRKLMGGRTYAKETELTRNVLLEWTKRQGAVKEVNGTTESDMCAAVDCGQTFKLQQCSRCKCTKYCSGQCQASDYKVHKKHCKVWAEGNQKLTKMIHNVDVALSRLNLEEDEQPDSVVVTLSQELQELMGGRNSVKEEELTRAVLFECAKRQGAVKEVNLVSITVQTMGGTETKVKLDDSDNSVRSLKRIIQDSKGISAFSQQLFLVSSKSSDNTESNVEAIQEPLGDNEQMLVDCCVALCIDAVEENSWDSSSPLITNRIFGISGEGHIIATKIALEFNALQNCLWTNRVMKSGKHWMSLKLTKAKRNSLNLFFGLVCDGAAWDKYHGEEDSTDAWYMNSGGALEGNGSHSFINNDEAGTIDEGQIVSMEADLDKGTLRFWVDGDQHGPGFTSGVQGPVRWGVCLGDTGDSVEIVSTPELQSWSPWFRTVSDDDVYEYEDY